MALGVPILKHFRVLFLLNEAMPLNDALGNAKSAEPDQTGESALFAETYLPHIV